MYHAEVILDSLNPWTGDRLALRPGTTDLGPNRLYCLCPDHDTHCWRIIRASSEVCAFCKANCEIQGALGLYVESASYRRDYPLEPVIGAYGDGKNLGGKHYLEE